MTLKHGGTGATNIIQRVINNETLPSELVEQSLLAELNKGTADINATKRDAAKAAGGSWITNVVSRLIFSTRSRVSLGVRRPLAGARGSVTEP